VKIAYIGGGSTRAPGTVAAFVQRGEHFAGSEITLFDRRPQRAWEARSGAEILLEAAIAAVRAAGQSPNRVAPRWEPAVGRWSSASRLRASSCETPWRSGWT
jgi:6-phospho-beta-glucosidase